MTKDDSISYYKKIFWIYFVLTVLFNFLTIVVSLFIKYKDENATASKWAGITLGACAFILIVINVRSYFYKWWVGMIASIATIILVIASFVYLYLKSKKKKTSD